MDPAVRRAPLETSANPDPRLDYVVSLGGSLALPGRAGDLAIELRYVPDRRVLRPESLPPYLDGLTREDWPGLEALAVAILDDMNNELVARWIQVALAAPPHHVPGLGGHDVVLEDRQPQWDNRALLARLRRF